MEGGWAWLGGEGGKTLADCSSETGWFSELAVIFHFSSQTMVCARTNRTANFTSVHRVSKGVSGYRTSNSNHTDPLERGWNLFVHLSPAQLTDPERT